jgi:peptidoglycan/xylan/chitin deacetylase (PgdA/CDA1 family)
MKLWFVSWKTLCLLAVCVVAALVLLGLWLFGRPAFSPVLEPVYAGPKGKHAVSLMINVDWGEEILPDILDELSRLHMSVTFFATGQFVRKHPALVQRMAEQGHEVANHGYSHAHPDRLSLEANQEEIIRTQAEIEGLGIQAARLFAPAYGEKAPHIAQAAEALGYRTVYWTIDTLDWKDPSPEAVQERVRARLEDGALILAHPKACTLRALPGIAAMVQARDYQFRTVSQLLGARFPGAEPGAG